MGYPTRAAVVAASDEPALTGASSTQQDAWYAEAKRAIEAFCGQRFDTWTATKTFDGDGSRRLPLDVRLATLTTLTIRDPFSSSLDASDVELSSAHDAIIVIPGAASGGNWVERALREGRPPIFPLGYGTVVVAGQWGWLDAEMSPTDLTTPVAVALRLDMEELARTKAAGLATTVRGLVPAGVQSISEGPLSISMGGADVIPDVSLPAAAQTLLADYIWQPVPAGG